MLKAIGLTATALLCFALNSILCRLALGMNLIDAPSFTFVRLFSGAVALSVILLVLQKNKVQDLKGSWLSAFFLFAYAVCFSFAYNQLTAGLGALILFGCVQTTMIVYGLLNGEKPKILEWLGLLVAIGGLVYLVSPGLSAPPVFSSLLMAMAGIAWGFYTLRGKGSANPIAETAGNFIRSVPMIAVAVIPFIAEFHSSKRGLAFAVISGAVTSGIGYSIWYAALKFHTATRAALLQLSVPVLTAVIAIIFLGENLSGRLIISSILILGGISTSIFLKRK